eukprot:10002954-Ditylum_brightwellii.AAC.1
MNPTTELKLTTEEEKEWTGINKETKKKVKEHIDEWFLKEDQQLKYVDQQSTHRPLTIKSIAAWVYTGLSRLASYSDSMVSKSINKLYPDHAAALNTANLVNRKFPKLGEIWKNQLNDVAKGEKKKKWKDNIN